jgi:hypothetical protein
MMLICIKKRKCFLVFTVFAYREARIVVVSVNQHSIV